MEKKMNTTIDFEFCDRSTAKLTLTFYAIYQLKSKNRSLYNRYNEAISNSQKNSYDELEMATILYAAYMCANGDSEGCMSEEEFLMKLGSDRVSVANAVKELINPKKQ